MSGPIEHEGSLRPGLGRYGVVASRFNRVVTQKLVSGAVAELVASGVRAEEIEVFWVPGSFEMPCLAQALAQSGRFAAIVCIGCVVRGDTDHYQFVASEAARGIAEASRSSGVPVIFGVLTTHTMEQALLRARPGHNAGVEAARCAMRMAHLMTQLSRGTQRLE